MKMMILAFGTMMILTSLAEARGRIGSHRYGGYTSHGRGSHYNGGY